MCEGVDEKLHTSETQEDGDDLSVETGENLSSGNSLCYSDGEKKGDLGWIKGQK